MTLQHIRAGFLVAALASLTAACSAEDTGNSALPAPKAVDPNQASADVAADELARLRALGYVDVVEGESSGDPVGARRVDPQRTEPGFTLFTNAHLCKTQLITPEGEVLRSWSHEPCNKWGNAVLLADGDLLAVHNAPNDGSAESVWSSRRLLRFDWNGELLWSRHLPVHHDIDPLPDGRIAALTYRHRMIPELHPDVAVRDHFISVLSSDGELLEEASLVEILQRAPEVFRLQDVRVRPKDGIDELDLLHSNAIEWMRDPSLAAKHPLYAPTHVLVCFRNQDAVVMIDWESKKPVWAWGQGEISGPHDATVLPNGNMLIFDNGLERKHSRVVELDPHSKTIVWKYQGPENERFFTHHRGAAQRLPGGNTLVTDSGRGRAFEIAPSGEIVWDFWNPNQSDEGKRIVIVRSRRVPQATPSFTRVD